MTKQTDALEAELGSILISSGMVKNAYDPDWTLMLKKLADTVTASNLERVEKAMKDHSKLTRKSFTELTERGRGYQECFNNMSEAIRQEFTE